MYRTPFFLSMFWSRSRASFLSVYIGKGNKFKFSSFFWKKNKRIFFSGFLCHDPCWTQTDTILSLCERNNCKIERKRDRHLFQKEIKSIFSFPSFFFYGCVSACSAFSVTNTRGRLFLTSMSLSFQLHLMRFIHTSCWKEFIPLLKIWHGRIRFPIEKRLRPLPKGIFQSFSLLFFIIYSSRWKQ